MSQSTVSRALRGERGISAQTIERVRAAAEALAYVSSETGRSLSTRRTRRIGVVTAELTNPFYPELVEPLRKALEAAGYHMLLILDSPDTPLTDVEGLASETGFRGELNERGVALRSVDTRRGPFTCETGHAAAFAMASWDLFSLTTVRCGLGAIAGHTVELVTSRIEDRERAVECIVPYPEVVLRSLHHKP